MNFRSPRPLNRWLAVLVVATALPLLVVAALAVGWLVQVYRADQDRRQADTARALALAVDGEIRSWKAAVTVLAASKALEQGRLADFYEEAQQLAAQHDGWVVLTLPSGEQLINTLRTFRSPHAMTSSMETIDAIFATGKPVVSDVFYGRVTQGYLIAVGVPVMRGHTVVNGLTLNFAPDRLTRLLESQHVPASWIAAINDQRQQVVARSPHIAERIGKPVMPWLAAAQRASQQGIVRGPLTDGRPGQLAFQRLTEAPWIVSLTVPVAEIQSAWHRPVLGFFLLSTLVALLAMGLGLGLAHRIARPVTDAARLATGVVQGQVPAFQDSGITEVVALQQAISEGAAAVETAIRSRDAAAEALREANASLEARVAERTRALATTNAALRQEVEERTRAEARLRTAVADKDALLREVHHRVKNNLQMLCDLMYLQMEAMPDRDEHQDLQDAYGRIYAIARLHEQLYQSMQSGRIVLAEYLTRLAGGFEELFSHATVRVEATVDGLALDLDRAIHVGLIVNELITNALKHALPKGQSGEVSVAIGTAHDQVRICVHDDGPGLPPDLDVEHVKSLGLRTVYLLARRLEGTLEIGQGAGTTFTLTFPRDGETPVEPKP